MREDGDSGTYRRGNGADCAWALISGEQARHIMNISRYGEIAVSSCNGDV